MVVTAIYLPESPDGADTLGAKFALDKPWVRKRLNLVTAQAAIQSSLKCKIPAHQAYLKEAPSDQPDSGSGQVVNRSVAASVKCIRVPWVWAVSR